MVVSAHVEFSYRVGFVFHLMVFLYLEGCFNVLEGKNGKK